jgi:hypothetical protein
MGEKQQWVIYHKDGESKEWREELRNDGTQMTIWIPVARDVKRT